MSCPGGATQSCRVTVVTLRTAGQPKAKHFELLELLEDELTEIFVELLEDEDRITELLELLDLIQVLLLLESS